MRLIDADALIESLVTVYAGEMTKFCFPCTEILGKVNTQPTIEERKVGKWIEISKHGGNFLVKCSECGNSELEESWFCPNCGARMEP